MENKSCRTARETMKLDDFEAKLWKYLSKQAALQDSMDRKRICMGIMKIIYKEFDK